MFQWNRIYFLFSAWAPTHFTACFSYVFLMIPCDSKKKLRHSQPRLEYYRFVWVSEWVILILFVALSLFMSSLQGLLFNMRRLRPEVSLPCRHPLGCVMRCFPTWQGTHDAPLRMFAGNATPGSNPLPFFIPFTVYLGTLEWWGIWGVNAKRVKQNSAELGLV